jgi:hypothetical protein
MQPRVNAGRQGVGIIDQRAGGKNTKTPDAPGRARDGARTGPPNGLRVTADRRRREN